MSRVVSVWLPEWAIEQIARRGLTGAPVVEPLALVESRANAIRITAANRAARELGIVAGLPLADARAAMPGLRTLPASPLRDRAALAGLARWLGRYGPSRNRDGEDGVWIDVTGVPHLFGGEGALLRDLVGRLAARGITARVGLADTPGAAHALARFATHERAPTAVAAPGCAATREALAPLPVAALRLPPESVYLLERLGLKRIGVLHGVPRAALEQRFRRVRGRHGAREVREAAASVILRLDQALGVIGEPRAPMLAPPEAHARLVFEEPLVTGTGLVEALQRLAAMLCGKLAAQGLGGRRFSLHLSRVDGTAARVRIGTRLPGRDPAHVVRLMEERLTAIDAGFGIDLMELEAAGLEREASEQGALVEGDVQRAAQEAACALVDRLVNRLGGAAVLRLAPVSSHIPERAQCLVPYAADGAKAPASAPPRLVVRPTLLLSPPEPVSVIAELPDGAPARLLWRRVQRRILKAQGPERIAPEWWRSLPLHREEAPNGDATIARGPRDRDYYRLEDETGAGYWVFREGLHGGEDEEEPRWFLQGLFA
ncbi:MAG: DNA polymerase Y family protein [Hyphomicrobiaceae bacterium]